MSEYCPACGDIDYGDGPRWVRRRCGLRLWFRRWRYRNAVLTPRWTQPEVDAINAEAKRMAAVLAPPEAT